MKIIKTKEEEKEEDEQRKNRSRTKKSVGAKVAQVLSSMAARAI